MKKFLYSTYTKFAAAALCVVFISAGMLGAVDGFIKFCEDDRSVYAFENSFEDSRLVDTMLSGAEAAVYNAYLNYAEQSGGNKEKTDGAALDENLKIMLASPLYEPNEVNYYVSVNDKVYTNCGAKSAKDLENTRFYRYFARDKNGSVTREGTTAMTFNRVLTDGLPEFLSNTDTITICANISDEYAARLEEEWNTQAEVIKDIFVKTAVYVILIVLLLIYLVCVSGKNKDGETRLMWLDHIWTEVHLALMVGAAVAATAACAVLLDGYQTSHYPTYMLRAVTTASAAAGGAVLITSGLSIIRKIKCKSFIKTSIICRIIKWCFGIFVKILRWIWKKLKRCKDAVKIIVSKKTNVMTVTVLLVYTAAIGICGMLVWESGAGLLIGVVLFGIAAFVLAHRGEDIDKIRVGAAEIRNGNLDYKIPEVKSSDIKVLAEDINEIGDGLNKTAAAKLKAERLKTDLITNVSHDLKTPLTSIISYTELLAKVDGLPEEAKDYAAVIAKKSESLKNLTQDLFEVSKVQSGNETFAEEKLDAALLIAQTLGERDNEIKKSELDFRVDTDKDLFFTADGRKMSRVMGNLIDNAVKYAMKGTRVFVRAFGRGNDVVIEIKNVSAYPMDFDAEEITGRFVRGDKSRTNEGNGLGLAIAKGYAEACGGKFDVIIDGDLFKVVICFKRM